MLLLQMEMPRIKSRLWEIRLKNKQKDWSSNPTLRMFVLWLISKQTRVMYSKYWTRWKNQFNSWAASPKMRTARRECSTTFWKSKNSSMKTYAHWTVWHSLRGAVVSHLDLCFIQWTMNQRGSFPSRALLWRGTHRSVKQAQLLFQDHMARNLWAMVNLSA